MSRNVALPKVGAFGTDFPRELALFEHAVVAKLRDDDVQEHGPFRLTAAQTAPVGNALPWDIVAVDPRGGARLVLLPAPQEKLSIGAWIGVKNDSDSTNTITVKPLTGTIDGQPSVTLTTARQFRWFYSTGAEWKGGPASAGTVAASALSVSVSTDQNDYAPAGWAGARFVLINATADVIFTGFSSASLTEKLKTIVHVGTEGKAIIFYEESTLSLAANRIVTPHPNDIGLLKNRAVDLWYDDAATRWRPV